MQKYKAIGLKYVLCGIVAFVVVSLILAALGAKSYASTSAAMASMTAMVIFAAKEAYLAGKKDSEE